MFQIECTIHCGALSDNSNQDVENLEYKCFWTWDNLRVDSYTHKCSVTLHYKLSCCKVTKIKLRAFRSIKEHVTLRTHLCTCGKSQHALAVREQVEAVNSFVSLFETIVSQAGRCLLIQCQHSEKLTLKSGHIYLFFLFFLFLCFCVFVSLELWAWKWSIRKRWLESPKDKMRLCC